VNYAEAIQFLYDLRLFGTKFGLDNTLRLAATIGEPHRRLRFIHVAGTNGKGSTCAMLESIYRHAGLRVGLFTSPHLVSFAERIQINRRPISEGDVTRLVQQFYDVIQKLPASNHPTFFEVVTVLALAYFAEHTCDLVIWETGLGGRLDATNIVQPLVSVITNIQFDHQSWLGQSRAAIASEKAGIIKPGVPVITGETDPEPLAVISETARANQAPLFLVTPDDAHRPPLDSLELPLLGEHQKLNAALAVAVARRLNDVIPVSPETLARGLSSVQWSGRLQIVQTQPGRTLILDGAHNPAGAETLRREVKKLFPASLPTLVLGVLSDKDWASICRILAPLAGRILLAPVSSERTTSPEQLRELCQRLNPYAQVETRPNLADAIRSSANDSVVVITGSLYFIGEAMEILKLSPAPALSERPLNEWGPPSRPS